MDMPKDELKYMIGEVFSKNIVEEWIKFYDLLNLDFSEENDIVDLFKPEEVGFNLPWFSQAVFKVEIGIVFSFDIIIVFKKLFT